MNFLGCLWLPFWTGAVLLGTVTLDLVYELRDRFFPQDEDDEDEDF